MEQTNATNFTCTLSNSIALSPNFYRTEYEKLIILAFLPLLAFLGDVGNFAFLFAAIRVPRMRTTANIYLATLAVSDMVYISELCILYNYSYFISPKIRNYPQRSSRSCWIPYLIGNACYYFSLEIIMLLSLERYYAICHPLKHRLFTG